MRCCKKISIFIALIFLSTAAFAASSSIIIKSADIQVSEDFYKLNAYMDVKFSEDIEEAINKGVPLNFILEFQVISPRKYWFDNEIITVRQMMTLSYHALSRQYILTLNGHQSTYDTLTEAKLEMADVEGWRVMEKSLIEKGEVYKARLLMYLDQAKLPKALQVETLSSEEWNISSQKFEWQPKELNK
jgi:hypothetical protein